MIIKGNFIYMTSRTDMQIRQQQFLHVEDGIVQSFYTELPKQFCEEEVKDYGDAIIIPAFCDLHVHAPQYLNRGIGFDKELLPWLETYTFPVRENTRILCLPRGRTSCFSTDFGHPERCGFRHLQRCIMMRHGS